MSMMMRMLKISIIVMIYIYVYTLVNILQFPVVTSITPAVGPIQGGTDVTITGTGLGGTTSVRFGGVEAGRFTVNSDTSITATTAAGTAPGSCSVDVTHARGSSQANSLYTFNVRMILNP